MAEFYSARGWEIPPLPWTNLSPPFSVRARIWEMGHGGGYLLSCSHRLEHDVPVENTLAMLEEALEYGVYPLPEDPPPGADTGEEAEEWAGIKS